MKTECSWETVYFDNRGFVSSKMKATFESTCLIPQNLLGILKMCHFEHIEAIHVAVSNQTNSKSKKRVEYLDKRPVGKD